MKRINLLALKVLLVVVALCSGGLMQAQRAQAILDKATAKIGSGSSVNCSFSITGDGGSVKGSFKSSGQKFQLATPIATTWYDGKSMWTSNAKTKEITLVNPTVAEVNEVNPFSYLHNYKSTYKAYFSRKKNAKCHLIVLNSRNPGSCDIKAIEIAINKNTFLPEHFIVRDSSDKVVTVNISQLSLSAKNVASTFVCPVSSMKDYELIDLR